MFTTTTTSKIEYQLLISQLDHLGSDSRYFTIDHEIGCLGHYLSESIKALQVAIKLLFSSLQQFVEYVR